MKHLKGFAKGVYVDGLVTGYRRKVFVVLDGVESNHAIVQQTLSILTNRYKDNYDEIRVIKREDFLEQYTISMDFTYDFFHIFNWMDQFKVGTR